MDELGWPQSNEGMAFFMLLAARQVFNLSLKWMLPMKKTHDKGCKPTSNAMHTPNAFWREEPQDKLSRALTSCAVLWRSHFLAWASLYIWTNTKIYPMNAAKQKRGLNPSYGLSPDLTYKALHVHRDKTLHEVEAFCSQGFILCWCRAHFSSSCNKMTFFCLWPDRGRGEWLLNSWWEHFSSQWWVYLDTWFSRANKGQLCYMRQIGRSVNPPTCMTSFIPHA